MSFYHHSLLNNMYNSEFQIFYNELLPNKICMSCTNKMKDIETFSKKVNDNQKILYQLLNNGREKLERFYSNLNVRLDIKEDLIDYPISLDNKENEKENLSLDRDVCSNINNDDVLVKSEQFYDEPQYSSEDETLHSLRQQKETSKKKTKGPTEPFAKPENETQISENPIMVIKNQHKCLMCSESLTTQNDLLKHYRKQHSSKKDKDMMNSYTVLEGNGVQSYKCNKCARVCDNLRAVKRHLEAHVKDRPFICKECGMYFIFIFLLASLEVLTHLLMLYWPNLVSISQSLPFFLILDKQMTIQPSLVFKMPLHTMLG